MSFLSKMFETKEDKNRLIGGFPYADLVEIKRKYKPDATYSDQYWVKKDVQNLNKSNILDFIEKGLDLKTPLKSMNPVFFYAQDQETLEVLEFFGVNIDINNYDINELDVTTFSLFIWKQHWDRIKNNILNIKDKYSPPITSITDIEKFRFLVSNGINLTTIKNNYFFKLDHYVYKIIFNYIWFGNKNDKAIAEEFINLVHYDFNKVVRMDLLSSSLEIPTQLLYFVTIFRVSNKNELKKSISRYEEIFGDINYTQKIGKNSNLFFLVELISDSDQAKFVEFLINHNIDPNEKNDEGITLYSWVMSNKKGKKRIINAIESTHQVKKNSNDISDFENSENIQQAELQKNTKDESKYDGFFFLELLQNDVIYFHEEDIIYKNGGHLVHKAWFNQTEIYKHLDLLNQSEAINSQLLKFCRYIESNPKLRVSADRIGKDLLVHFYGENLTGILAINLFADHFLKVLRQNENKTNNLVLLVETRVIRGIPNYKEYLHEFFRSVINYNPLYEGELSILETSFANFDVGTPRKKNRPKPKKDTLQNENFQENLYRSIKYQDLDMFIEIISQIDINSYRISNNLSLLILTCSQNLSNFSIYLINQGVDVNVVTTEHLTGDDSYLQSSGISGVSALIFACQYQAVEVVKALVSAGANVNQANMYGMTPLMKAAQKNNVNIMNILIENGARINDMNSNGTTALDLAIEESSNEACDLLIKLGAKQ